MHTEALSTLEETSSVPDNTIEPNSYPLYRLQHITGTCTIDVEGLAISDAYSLYDRHYSPSLPPHIAGRPFPTRSSSAVPAEVVTMSSPVRFLCMTFNQVVLAISLFHRYIFLLGMSTEYVVKLNKLMAAHRSRDADLNTPTTSPIPTISPFRGKEPFDQEWRWFVELSLKQFKMQGVSCALLASSVVALLQVDSFSDNSVVETSCIVLFICSASGFLVNMAFYLRLSSLHTWQTGMRWVKDASESRNEVFCNAPALLATSRASVGWSVILLPVMFFLYIWRRELVGSPQQPGEAASIALRLVPTVVLILAIIHSGFVALFFVNLGGSLDNETTEIPTPNEATLSITGFYGAIVIAPPPEDERLDALEEGRIYIHDGEDPFCGHSNDPGEIHSVMEPKSMAGLRYNRDRRPSVFSPF